MFEIAIQDPPPLPQTEQVEAMAIGEFAHQAALCRRLGWTWNDGALRVSLDRRRQPLPPEQRTAFDQYVELGVIRAQTEAEVRWNGIRSREAAEEWMVLQTRVCANMAANRPGDLSRAPDTDQVSAEFGRSIFSRFD